MKPIEMLSWVFGEDQGQHAEFLQPLWEAEMLLRPLDKNGVVVVVVVESVCVCLSVVLSFSSFS